MPAYSSLRNCFDQSIQDRAITEEMGNEPAVMTRFASAEDIILLKLEWCRRGNEVSERQWNDVLAVVKLQGSVLDRDYLRHWAAQIGVDDLLDRVLQAAN